MAFFNRKARVTIGKPEDIGILVEDLRITFNCKKTQSSTDPNTCSIDIYNMNESRRNSINDIDDILILEAGYAEADGLEELFIGDIQDVNIKVERPNTITTIEVGDGQKYITEDKTSLSFGSNTSVLQILKEIVKKTSLESNLDKLSFTDSKFNYGYSFVGSTKNALDELTDIVDITWSIQNNIIQFDKEALLGPELVPQIGLDKDTGLIGVPERIKVKKARKKGKENINGWRVRSLLQPKAVPGGTLKISSSITGNNKKYKIINVEHAGDTWSGEYTTTMEVREI